MSSVAKAPSAEKFRLRGRNMTDVVNQLVNEYNSSNGWQVLRVVPNALSFEVYLERSTAQAKPVEKAETKATPVKAPVKAAAKTAAAKTAAAKTAATK